MVKIIVTTHSGDEDLLSVDEFNADEMAEVLNDQEIHSIALGGNIYSRIDVKNIKVAEENEVDEINEK